jgi:hypothetical protein
VDTALLAKNEQASELSLDTINSPQTPNINNSARNQQSSLPANFGVGLPYPKSVIDKLGLLFTS